MKDVLLFCILLITTNDITFSQSINQKVIEDIILLYLDEQVTIVDAKLRNAKFIRIEETPSYELRGIKYSNSFVYSFNEVYKIKKFGGIDDKAEIGWEDRERKHVITFITESSADEIRKEITVDIWSNSDGSLFIEDLKKFLTSINRVSLIRTEFGYLINNAEYFKSLSTQKYFLSSAEISSSDFIKYESSILPIYWIKLNMSFVKKVKI